MHFEKFLNEICSSIKTIFSMELTPVSNSERVALLLPSSSHLSIHMSTYWSCHVRVSSTIVRSFPQRALSYIICECAKLGVACMIYMSCYTLMATGPLLMTSSPLYTFPFTNFLSSPDVYNFCIYYLLLSL